MSTVSHVHMLKVYSIRLYVTFKVQCEKLCFINILFIAIVNIEFRKWYNM